MRILLTADPELPVPPPLYGGIERIVDWLARELIAAGHELGLVARRDSRVPGATLLPWPVASSRGVSAMVSNTRHLAAVARQFRPEVLHSFSRLGYLLGVAPLKLPRIMSFQRNPTPRTVRWSSRIHGRQLVYTGCSDWISAIGRKAGGHWQTIHNGVELSRYTFSPTVASDAPLLFLSRLDRVKAPHLAIEAAREAGVSLILAGNVAERGPERLYFEEQVAPHLDGVQVCHVGPVDDCQKNELLGRARALLVPIQWDEPFGIVFAEALACGTPVIASPRGALPEIIRPGIEGFLPEKASDIPAAINNLAQIDRAACRSRAESHFSSHALARQYSDLYERLLGGVP